jgi:hypothetical protein
MMIDVLHQLLKKMITYMVHWLEQLIEKSVLISKKEEEDQTYNLKYTQINITQSVVLLYLSIYRTENLSEIQQC